MKYDVCREFLNHLDADGEFKVGDSPPVFGEWLDTLKLPWDLSQILRSSWPRKCGYIRHIALWNAKGVFKNPSRDKFVSQRFLAIGSAPNGDYLVANFSTDNCEVGFISHEAYYEHEDSLVNCYEPIARGLDSLFFKLIEGHYLPTDYYAAKAFNHFLKEEMQGSAFKSPSTDT
jgi:hypothetical protein